MEDSQIEPRSSALYDNDGEDPFVPFAIVEQEQCIRFKGSGRFRSVNIHVDSTRPINNVSLNVALAHAGFRRAYDGDWEFTGIPSVIS